MMLVKRICLNIKTLYCNVPDSILKAMQKIVDKQERTVIFVVIKVALI